MLIGRVCILQDSSTASRTSTPFRTSSTATATSRIEFLTMLPARAMNPFIEVAEFWVSKTRTAGIIPNRLKEIGTMMIAATRKSPNVFACSCPGRPAAAHCHGFAPRRLRITPANGSKPRSDAHFTSPRMLCLRRIIRLTPRLARITRIRSTLLGRSGRTRTLIATVHRKIMRRSELLPGRKTGNLSTASNPNSTHQPYHN